MPITKFPLYQKLKNFILIRQYFTCNMIKNWEGTLTGTLLPKLQQIINNKSKHYYSFTEPKKTGGERTITPPRSDLKQIQKYFKKLFNKIPWPIYVQGGVRKRSIFTNAIQHLNKEMVVNLDIRNFFPSTSTYMVSQTLIKYGMKNEAAELIAELCTYDNSLPQGACTSTALANLVFLEIDNRFDKLCKKHKFTYTRYVDDISISGEKILITFKGELIKIIEQGGYKLAIEKMSFAGRNKPQIVNNILVNDKLKPTNKFIMKLKSEIRLCWVNPSLVADMNGMTKGELQKNLWGRISFIRQFDKKIAREVRSLMTKEVGNK